METMPDDATRVAYCYEHGGRTGFVARSKTGRVWWIGLSRNGAVEVLLRATPEDAAVRAEIMRERLAEQMRDLGHDF